MKNLKVEKASKTPRKPYWFGEIANKEVIENSYVILDLSENLAEKIDLFLSNTNLTKPQQNALIKIIENVYGEACSDCFIESK